MSKRLDDLGKLQDVKISSWKNTVESRGKEIQSLKVKISRIEQELKNQRTQETISTSPMPEPNTTPHVPNPVDASTTPPVLIQPMQTSTTPPVPIQPIQTSTTAPVPIQPMQTSTTPPAPNSIHRSSTPTAIPPMDTTTTPISSHQSLTNELQKELNNMKSLIDSDNGTNFVIDNIDIRQNVYNMTEENQNIDYHWVNANIVFNRVSGNNLSDRGHIKDVMDIENIEVLPTTEDHLSYRKNLKVHIQRILVKRIPCLRHLKDSILHHIPHAHTKDMKKPNY